MKMIASIVIAVVLTWFFLTYGGVRSVCHDGYLSQSYGRGACSWHGGVMYDWRDLMPASDVVIESDD